MTVSSVNPIKHIFAVVPPGFFIANKVKHGRKKLKENGSPLEGADMLRSTFYRIYFKDFWVENDIRDVGRTTDFPTFWVFFFAFFTLI